MDISEKLIRAIVDEDFVSAKQMTNDLLYQAAGESIDAVKAEVASEVFEGCEECEEEAIEEEKAKADFDKDGQVETSKDEVLGSRINAAVKSGKLSPEAAAKTKNKGKYGVPARYNPKWMK